jgi:hypothetical protein
MTGHVILALKEPFGNAAIIMLTAIIIICEFVVPEARKSRKTREAAT